MGFLAYCMTKQTLNSMPPDLALCLTLNSSNYPCLEQIFKVPKVLEPLKFSCRFILLIDCVNKIKHITYIQLMC